MTLRALSTALTRRPQDEIALVHGDERWTWGRLSYRAGRWCAWLRRQGVGGDDLVAFALPNGPDFIALSFGIYQAGATPAPLSPKLPSRELADILETMRPAAFVSAVPDLATVEPAIADADAHIAASWKACTSGGSTGRPKVIVDGRPAGFAPETDFIAIPGEGRVLIPGPLYHNAPFSAAMFALWRGCTVVTMPRFDAEGALRLVADERVEWSLMVPTMMHRIWRLPDRVKLGLDLLTWRTVVHTAEPMPVWLKRAWIEWLGPDHIWEVYGATEGLVRCWIGGQEWLDRPGSVGRPIGGSRLLILDQAHDECPVGVDGEIYAMPADGPRSSYRYIGAERRATTDGWESVGDIGHLDADGYLYLADRRNDLIISGGVNVWPAEVEAALLRHPAIRSCAVVGLADADFGQRVHAVVECGGPALELRDLRRFLDDWLVKEKQPRSLAFQNGPVRDDAGKVRKSALTSTAQSEAVAT